MSDSRKTRKTKQIVDGAKAVFREQGFGGASVDEIARRAGVSKATVYAHFDDKQGLFAAAIQDEANSSKAWMSDFPSIEAAIAEALEPEEHPSGKLNSERIVRFVVGRFLRFLLSPTPRANYRIVVAESSRFPELGQLLWTYGPEAGLARMASFLSEVAEHGLLDIEDPHEASRVLCDLVDGHLSRKVRMGALKEVPEETIEAEIDAISKIFLRLYSPEKRSSRGS